MRKEFTLMLTLIGGCGSGGMLDAMADAQVPDTSNGPYLPVLTSAFTRVYAPAMMRYLNDHTIVRGPDGTWHVYGITNNTIGTPQTERRFLHASAPTLFGPWSDQEDILTADTMLDEVVLWAPHVIEPMPGHWTMYYWAGFPGSPPPPRDRGLRRADSTDLTTWTRHEATSDPAQRPPGGRDPMAVQIHGSWYLYSADADPLTNQGRILLSMNANLDDASGWTPPVAVITDPVASYSWGNLESPFLVPYHGGYYLFLTRTDAPSIDYERTLVFYSSDPTTFAWRPITQLPAHAAEIVTDGAHNYITSAGWTSALGEENRGLSIASFEWISAPSGGLDF